ncbi:hypothetical protein LTR15_005782 [Elasticomyces elasticus]|nr:hypothetical protein LTR15_005782 [Elasticomyces elasticus]
MATAINDEVKPTSPTNEAEEQIATEVTTVPEAPKSTPKTSDNVNTGPDDNTAETVVAQSDNDSAMGDDNNRDLNTTAEPETAGPGAYDGMLGSEMAELPEVETAKTGADTVIVEGVKLAVPEVKDEPAEVRTGIPTGIEAEIQEAETALAIPDTVITGVEGPALLEMKDKPTEDTGIAAGTDAEIGEGETALASGDTVITEVEEPALLEIKDEQVASGNDIAATTTAESPALETAVASADTDIAVAVKQEIVEVETSIAQGDDSNVRMPEQEILEAKPITSEADTGIRAPANEEMQQRKTPLLPAQTVFLATPEQGSQQPGTPPSPGHTGIPGPLTTIFKPRMRALPKTGNASLDAMRPVEFKYEPTSKPPKEIFAGVMQELNPRGSSILPAGNDIPGRQNSELQPPSTPRPSFGNGISGPWESQESPRSPAPKSRTGIQGGQNPQFYQQDVTAQADSPYMSIEDYDTMSRNERKPKGWSLPEHSITRSTMLEAPSSDAHNDIPGGGNSLKTKRKARKSEAEPTKRKRETSPDGKESKHIKAENGSSASDNGIPRKRSRDSDDQEEAPPSKKAKSGPKGEASSPSRTVKDEDEDEGAEEDGEQDDPSQGTYNAILGPGNAIPVVQHAVFGPGNKCIKSATGISIPVTVEFTKELGKTPAKPLGRKSVPKEGWTVRESDKAQGVRAKDNRPKDLATLKLDDKGEATLVKIAYDPAETWIVPSKLSNYAGFGQRATLSKRISCGKPAIVQDDNGNLFFLAYGGCVALWGEKGGIVSETGTGRNKQIVMLDPTHETYKNEVMLKTDTDYPERSAFMLIKSPRPDPAKYSDPTKLQENNAVPSRGRPPKLQSGSSKASTPAPKTTKGSKGKGKTGLLGKVADSDDGNSTIGTPTPRPVSQARDDLDDFFGDGPVKMEVEDEDDVVRTGRELQAQNGNQETEKQFLVDSNAEEDEDDDSFEPAFH